MTLFVDHIAVLTPNLQRLSDQLPAFCQRFAVEQFPSEGTREQYIALTPDGPRLLLLEPLSPAGDGPYARSLHKRGPGLHHVGVLTPSLAAVIPFLSATGLLLHPTSLRTFAQGVIWACRPGLPFLLEITEGERPAIQERFVLKLPQGLPCPDFATQLFDNLHLSVGTGPCLELHCARGGVLLDLG